MGMVCCSCCCQAKEEDDFSLVPAKGKYQGTRDFLGRRDGKGIYCFLNGDIYDGQWRKDKKHGYGEYRFFDGRILTGYFSNDKFVGTTPQADIQDTEDTLFSGESAKPLTSEDVIMVDKMQKEKAGNVGKMKKLKSAAGKGVGKLKKMVGLSKKDTQSPFGVDGVQSRNNATNSPLIFSEEKVTYSSFAGENDREYQEQLRRDQERRAELRDRVERHKLLREAMRKKYNLPDRSECV